MTSPLADKMRAKSFEEIVGQDHLVGKEGFLTRVIQKKQPLSIILWGPPGSGKTSIARLYAQAFSMRFVSLSAVWDGIAELRRIVKETTETPLLGQRVMIFVDEIHRFNKAQQDAFLPFLETGSIILVGATVENPSYHLNNALLSRVRVLTLNSLDDASLEKLIQRFESLEGPLPLTKDSRQWIIHLSQGDGRYLFNMIENLRLSDKTKVLELKEVQELLQKRAPLFDRAGEQHYNLISALHKSVRGSDPDAALYWFARILEGGEDPLFLARRLIRMASEDIGLADPQALPLSIAARDAYEMLGSPEGELALSEVVVYLALAPKSNALYKALTQAREQASQTSHLSPPKIILNAPTRLMKELGYGKGYIYDHDTPEGFSGQNYFPDEMERQQFYQPIDRGFEREMKKRADYFDKLRKKKE